MNATQSCNNESNFTSRAALVATWTLLLLLIAAPVTAQDVIRPEEPQNLLLGKSGSDAVLTWDGVTLDVLGQSESLDHYNVYRGEANDYFPDTVSFTNRIGAPAVTTLIDPGALGDLQNYFYLVSAVDAEPNEGNSSAPRVAAVPLLSAEFPTNGIDLLWSASSPGSLLSGYRVYYGTDPVVFDSVVDVGNTTSFKITGLSPAVQYYSAVVAYDTSLNETALTNTITGQLGQDYYVDIATGSDVTGDGTPEMPWQHIGHAVVQATGNCTTIHVAPGTYDATAGEVFPIDMEDCVSVIGRNGAAATIVDAQGTGRVIQAENFASATRLEGFTITGGSVSGNGAGIYVDNAALEIVGNVVSGNQTTGGASELGGGIYITNAAAAQVVGNTISGNSAISTADAFGGGIYIDSAAEVRGNQISGNSVSGPNGRGAGVYLIGDAVIVANSIMDNTGAIHGGGIHATNPGVSCRIENNFVVGNAATGAGGGVRLSGSTTLALISNTISYNTGDGLATDDAGAAVLNNIISHNSGYGIREESAAADPVSVRYNDLYLNAAGMYRDEDSTDYSDLASFESSVAEASDNLDVDPLFTDPEDDADHTDDDYHLRRQSACIDAGYDGAEQPATDVDAQIRPYDYERVDFNGAVDEYDVGADEFFIVGFFVDVLAGSDLTGDGTTGNPWAHITHALGQVAPPATIFVRPGTYDTTLDSEGNAETFPLLLTDGVSVESTGGTAVTVIDANQTSRVIEAQNIGIWTRIEGFTITGGSIVGSGAGIWLNSSDVEVLGNLITGNNTSGSSSSELGGGIYVTGTSSALISTNDINGNAADGLNTGYGGGIALSGTQTEGTRVVGNTIVNNSAGPSSSAYGAGVYTSSAAEISGNTIHGNTMVASNGYGGGIYASTRTLLLANSIVDNTGARYGGGIYGSGLSSTSRIENNFIVGNSATTTGGGIQFQSGTDVTAINNTIAYNTGDGVAVNNPGLRLLNNAITHNTGYGIHEVDDTADPAEVRYNDLFENAAGLYRDEGVTTIVNLELLEAFLSEVSSNVAVDPAYASPENDADHTDDDYHLLAGSGCVDAGFDGAGAPGEDFDGDPRAFDEAGVDNNGPLWEFDIGADEYVGTDTVAPLFAGIEEARPGDTFADLVWSAALDSSLPITYDVYVRTALETHDFNAPDFSTTSVGFRVTGLTNLETYFFVVKARDALGQRDDNVVELSATPAVNPLVGVFVDVTFGSDLTGDGTFGNPWKHITYALTQVAGPETVWVLPGTYDTTVGDEGFSEIFPIVMLDGVSLRSVGGSVVTIIDADETEQVMRAENIGAGTILEGFTITGGSSTVGGGLYMNSSALEVRSNRITGNRLPNLSSSGSGGGIYVIGNSPTVIEDNEISDNFADGQNSSYGGGIFMSSSGAARIENNRITGNTCGFSSTAYGGGLYVANAAAQVLRNDFDNNVVLASTRYGGGVYISGSTLFEGNRVRDNGSATYGGGIYATSSSGRIVNNLVVGNEATLFGGGIRLNSSSAVEVVNNTFAYNTGDGISLNSNGPVLSNNAITHNSGYGIREEDTSSDPAAIRHNALFANGSGVYLDEGTATILNLALMQGFLAEADGNVDADPQYVAPENDADHTDDFYGLLDTSDLIDAGDDDVVVPGDDREQDARPYDFVGVDNNGGLLDFDIGADEFFIPVADLTAPVFAGIEYATSGGGSVCIDWSKAADPSRPVLYNVYRATTPGAQNFGSPTETTYRTSLCDTAVVTGTSYCYVVRAGDYAGNEESNTVELCATAFEADVWVDVAAGSNVTGDGSSGNPWRHITFALTQVAGTGSRTVRVRPGTYDTTVDIDGYSEIFPIALAGDVSLISTDGSATTILDAENGNRVIVADGVGSTTRLEGFTITGGTIAGNGAGILINNASPEIVDNLITGNTTTGNVSGELGGGIYVSGTSSPLIQTNEISNNQADGLNAGYGGGIALSSTSVSGTRVLDNTISGNTAGPASSAYGGGIYTAAAAEIRGNRIHGNTQVASNGYGAGIYASTQTILLANSIIDNTGARFGGGIYGSGLSSTSRIENNFIVGNAASTTGGGIQISSGTTVALLNNTIAYNIGDGVSFNNSGATLLNNLITFNTGYGVREEDSSADPTTVQYNDLYLNGSGLYFDEGSTTYVNLDLLESNVPEVASNLEIDPGYVSGENDTDHTDDDYHLLVSSGVVDAGFDGPEIPADDFDGDLRAFDVAGSDNNGSLWEYDLGADEFVGLDTVAPLFSGLETARAGDAFVDLLWSPALDSSPPIVYDVYVRTALETHDYGAPDFSTSDSYFQVTGLANGETYFFVVKARDGLGQRDGNVVELSATPAVNGLVGVFVDVNFGSDLTGDGSYGNPWRHITYAISQVTGPETVWVRPGTHDTTVDGDGFSEIFPILLKDGVSVRSTGGATVTTIDAESVDRVIRADNVGAGTILDGFTITGGLTASSSGPGVYLTSSSVEVRSNRIVGNRTTGANSSEFGGGVYVVGNSTAIIEDNEISGNRVDGQNGCYGGGIYMANNGASRIEGNRIFGNTCGFATTAYGGGIYISNSTGGVVVDNLIDGNIVSASTKYGGGIYLQGSATVERNRIRDHVGVTYGGGIYASSSAGPIRNNVIVGNEATVQGGGIRLVSSSSAEVVNNTISYNTGDGISLNTSGATLTNNAITHNTGYGIREEDSSSDPAATRYNDLYLNDSGLYFDEGSTAYVSLGLFQSNVPEATGNVEVDPRYTAPENDADHTDDNYGLLDTSDLIDAGDDDLIVPADDIHEDVRPFDFVGVDNNAALMEFDIGADEFFIPVGDVTPPIFGGLESATGGPNQVCLDWTAADDPSRPVLYSIYRAESSGTQNFGIPTATTYRSDYCDTATIIGINYCYVVRAEDYSGNQDANTVEFCADPIDVDIYVDIAAGSDLTGDGTSGNPWRHITFALTQAAAPATVRVRPGTYDTTVDGDGFSEVFPLQLVDGVTIVSTDGAVMTTIDAEGSGRVIEADGVGAGTRIEGFTIIGGSITGHGAGVYIFNASPEIVSNVITGNSTTGSSSAEQGGGIYVGGSSAAVIENNEITNNIADGINSGYGGGIALSGSNTAGTRIENNLIEGNTVGPTSSVYGGGIYVTSNAEIRGNRIHGNIMIGTGYGGGVYASSQTQLIQNSIVDNTGAEYGGGIYGSGLSATSVIENNIVAGNSAALSGGGMLLRNGSNVTVFNNTITYNTGDGVSSNTSGAELINNLITHNTGYGIREEDSTADFASVRFNDLYLNGSGLYLDEGTTTFGILDLLESFLAEVSSNLAIDPEYVSPENDSDHTDDDYRLLASSGCIDAAFDGAGVPAVDFDNDARAFDAAGVDNNGPLWEYDIGADEWIGTDTTPPVFAGLEQARPGDTFVDLLWSPAFDSTAPVVYDVYVRTTVQSHDYGVPDFTTSMPFYQVTGLNNGETYFFVVKARDGLGQRDGNVVELSATPAANGLTGVFVDVTFGSDVTGDGSFTNPWRHITFALTQVTGPETIWVRPGTHDTTVDSEGFSEVYPIMLEDGVSVRSTDGSAVTTIDAEGTERVFRAESVGSGAVLEGFTITGGVVAGSGGGLYVNSSSLEVRSNRIVGNRTSGTNSSEFGGGIYIIGTSAAVIEENEITGNTVDGQNGCYGGGIYLAASGATRVEGNTISGNTCGFATSAYGGGIYVSSAASDIIGNRIDGNVVTASNRYGGGIYAGNVGDIDGNWIRDHANATQGGGIYAVTVGSIVNNVIVGNEATNLGAGMRLAGSSSEIVNNTVAYNLGDGISMVTSGSTLTNNAVTQNSGYGIREEDTAADPTAFRHNNLYMNGAGFYLDEGSNGLVNIDLVNSFLTGADGNVALDPLYAAPENDTVHTDDSYVLLDGSPMIDAGDDAVVVPVDDIHGDTRPYDFAGTDNNGLLMEFDIGADEFFVPVGDATPPVFAGLADATAGGDRICLEWFEADDPSRPVLYNVYRSLAPGGQNFGSPTATTYRTSLCDETVSSGTSYCYVVRAEDYSANEETNSVELCATAFDGDVWVDATTGSDLTGDGTSGNPWRHITYALTQISGPRTVRILPGTYDATVDGDGYSEIFPIPLVDGATLIGTGGAATTAIDAQGTNGVLKADGISGARIEGLTITGGDIEGNGGGISINNADVEIIDNVITNNVTSGVISAEQGGGIYVAGSSDVLIQNNEITNNTADGGSSSARGGGISSSSSGTVRIDGNLISGNTAGSASSVYGAGIYTGTTAEITSNDILNNTLIGSNRYGAGVWINGDTQLIANRIVDNTGASWGGGIYGNSLSANSKVENNYVIGNSATLFGGGIRLVGSPSASLINNTFAYNTGDGISLNTSGLTILNNVISHNSGYGINEEDTSADPGIVQYNNLFFNGAGLYFDEDATAYFSLASLEAAVAEVSLNLAIDPDYVSPENDADHTDDDYHLLGSSGCIDAGWDGPEVPSTDFDGDGRAFDAAGVDNNGPLWEFDIGADEWIGTDTVPPVFAGLEEARAGDTFVDLVWAAAFDSSAPITYDVYVRTSVESHDFGIPDFSTTSTFFQVTGLTNGETYFFVVKARDGLGQRDANVVELSATPALNGLTGVFVDDTFGSDLTGDGSFANPWRHLTYALTQVTGPETIWVRPGIHDPSVDAEGYSELFPILLKDGVSLRSTGGAAVTTIDAQGVNRVLHGDNVGSGAVLEGFTVTGGSVAGQGAGIYLITSSLEIRSNVITGNATTGSSSSENGGGIYVIGTSSVVIENNVISDNAADGQNSCYGGGIYVSGSGGTRIEDNTIVANRCGFASSVFGGGIYFSANDGEILGNVIDGNILTGSTEYGGGIYVSGTSTVERNFIRDHVNINYGSGIYASVAGRIANNVIAGNEATTRGGGMRLVSSGSAEVVNNTVAYNTGDGIAINTSGATLTNNAITHNSGYGIYEEDSSSDPSAIDNNDLYSNGSGPYFDEGTTAFGSVALMELSVPEAANNIELDPAYIAPENDADHTDDDYGLLDTSPCIDAGDDNAAIVPLDDIEDDVRPYDFIGVDNNGALMEFDIGADEFFIPAGDVTAPTFAGLESANGATGEVCLDWEAATDPSRPVLYKIYRSETSGGQNFAAATDTTYRTDYCDTTVVGLTNYCYVVRAEDYSVNEESNVGEFCAAATP